MLLTRLESVRGSFNLTFKPHATLLHLAQSDKRRFSVSVVRLTMSQKSQLSVAIVGVGLVGSELISQLLSLPSPSPFKLVSLTSSKRTLFSKEGLSVTPATWTTALTASSSAPDLIALAEQLSTLPRAVLVDNTAAQNVAELYPEFLKRGVHVVTPNKKAFSGTQQLYDEILRTSRESGARWLNESTVGAGLPVVQTLKDLVSTGDKVRCSIYTGSELELMCVLL